VDLDDVNHMMGLELPTDVSDTIGGLVYSDLGQVPAVGDKVRIQNVEITVLAVERRQIKKVKVERLPAEGEAEDKLEPQAAAPLSNRRPSDSSSYAEGVAHD
jgi:CBS domain containing-hemolysin-like protein